MKHYLARALIVVGLAGLAGGSNAVAQARPDSVAPMADRQPASLMSTADRKFITAAAQGAMAQVHFGQLAVHKGLSGQVKELAERMVDENTVAAEQLKRIAEQKRVTWPDDISAAQRRQFQRLSKISGAEFDQEYMKYMRSRQFAEVNKFRSTARAARDPDVKAFAQNSLPLVEEQLEIVVFAAAMTLA